MCEAQEREASGPKCDDFARASNKEDVPRSLDVDPPSYRETIRPNDTIMNVARVTPWMEAMPLKAVGFVGWTGTEKVILLETVAEDSDPT